MVISRLCKMLHIESSQCLLRPKCTSTTEQRICNKNTQDNRGGMSKTPKTIVVKGLDKTQCELAGSSFESLGKHGIKIYKEDLCFVGVDAVDSSMGCLGDSGGKCIKSKSDVFHMFCSNCSICRL